MLKVGCGKTGSVPFLWFVFGHRSFEGVFWWEGVESICCVTFGRSISAGG